MKNTICPKKLSGECKASKTMCETHSIWHARSIHCKRDQWSLCPQCVTMPQTPELFEAEETPENKWYMETLKAAAKRAKKAIEKIESQWVAKTHTGPTARQERNIQKAIARAAHRAGILPDELKKEVMFLQIK